MNSLSISSVSPNHERSQHFLALLGKKPATTCLRAVYPKGHAKLTEPKRDRGRKHPCWDSAQVERWQHEGLNVYVVINDGGQSDQSISSCRALFCEWDNREKDWQLTAWQELGLPEPTMQVDSGGRSIHSYWVFEEPIEPSCWRDLQARLLAHTGSDLTLKNLSRVMRLPGCYYLKAPQDVQPLVMTEIVSEAGVRYTAEQLEQVLPRWWRVRRWPARWRLLLQVTLPPPATSPATWLTSKRRSRSSRQRCLTRVSTPCTGICSGA